MQTSRSFRKSGFHIEVFYMYRLLFLLFFPIVSFALTPPPNLNREAQHPFISGDAFREYCDFAYDDLDRSLNPLDVTKPGSTIFLRFEGDYVKEFFTKIHPLIPVKYILITHNNDDDTPGPYRTFLDDDKIMAWFADNYDGYKHEKLHPLPMGIANFCWGSGNVLTINLVMRKKIPKTRLAHMCISTWTYPKEREMVLNKFSNAPFVYSTGQKPFDDYLRDAASAKFSIAPRGNALDTHRIWECLLIGTIPIVKTSSLDVLYENLPILIIDDWDQVTEEFLNEKYVEMKNKTYDMQKMWIDYWLKVLDNYKLNNL